VRFDDFFFSEYNEFAPQIVADKATVSFGVALGNSDSMALKVVKKNIAEDLSVSVTGTDAAYFSVPSVISGDSAVLYVKYNPLVAGNHSATLVINGGSVEREIALSGVCTDVSALVITPISDICTGAATSPYDEQTVNVTGVVTAKMSNSNGFFIQEASGAGHGLYIYRSAIANGVTVGDSVVVTGAISEYQGLTELTPAGAANVIVIASEKELPAAANIPLVQMGKVYHAVLVTITDSVVVSSIDGTSYTVNYNEDSAVVNSNIFNSVASVEVDYMLSVTGIGYYYQSKENIMPRSATDVVVLAQTPPETAIELPNAKVAINVYPNPVSDVLTVENASGLVELLSLQGLRVKSVVANGGRVGIDMRDVSVGMYFLRTGNGVVKVVKK
jgi:hypothetical protein